MCSRMWAFPGVELDLLTNKAKDLGAKGLLYIAYLPGGDIKSSAKKASH